MHCLAMNRGARSGAHQCHIGYCEQADGDTLFLGEIVEMDYNIQAKCPRFLQDHVVQLASTEPDMARYSNRVRASGLSRCILRKDDITPVQTFWLGSLP